MTQISNYFAIEGMDGCGKTTLLDKIMAELIARDTNYAFIEEPGQHGERQHLRRIMTTPNDDATSSDKNMVRTLLMAADRVILQPYLRKLIDDNIPILASRSFMSSVVYQGIIGGELDLVTAIHKRANVVFPDIIFVLRISGNTSIHRMTNRGSMDDIEKHVSNKANEYAAAYDYAESFVRHISGGKTKVIYLDGEAAPDDIFAVAMAHIKERMQWN